MSNFLYLDGIPADVPSRAGASFFAFNPQGSWRFSIDDGLNAVEVAAVNLHETIVKAIFKELPYAEMLQFVPPFIATLGHNSEAKGSKSDFEKVLSLTNRIPELHRFLYLYDCQRLVSAIQECAKEIIQLQGEFYRTFNLEPFFYPVLQHEDGIRYSTSPVVTKLFAFLSFIFIRMHSLLDYTVKVAMEAEKLQINFTRYPKMASSNAQYGDRKRLKLNKKRNTLFEDCSFLVTVETLRNHIIHNGLLDDMPKAYEVIKENITVEKYILMPDMTDGYFDKLRNRNLFYNEEDKINQRLPNLVKEFMNRQEATLHLISEDLRSRYNL
ncbi:hypothetical protein [Pseudochrobactrum kiredjianiae]|uniref:Cthe-2314-like HEPN domain-containing protein n=1 Tax=Pseudochrobactrum kiredjianiae TaxID=386305 RepID=A0ABW3V0T7_9HYPH|nr:hypothetical protein [Pseudochrobactrum kiredjianiae]MDM7852692.1 hypothetical protein [Pseudochrobactrum kiredjianiae]